MSYITYQVQCVECCKIYNTAFGIVGTTQIAAPLEKCPECGGAIKKVADGWATEAKAKMGIESLCLHCDCNGHHLEAMYGDDEDLLYLSVEVKPRGILSALREAWKLFCGVRRGCYEEVILDKEGMNKLYDYLRRIAHYRKWNTDKGVK